eukprot:COSAG04_NODE_1326_length_7211_cov_1.774606_5_plen_59_part_00
MSARLEEPKKESAVAIVSAVDACSPSPPGICPTMAESSTNSAPKEFSPANSECVNHWI